jgi:hypothetical protein
MRSWEPNRKFFFSISTSGPTEETLFKHQLDPLDSFQNLPFAEIVVGEE